MFETNYVKRVAGVVKPKYIEFYIVIDKKTNTDDLISRGINVDENFLICKEHLYDIDTLVEETWIPLGVS